MEVCVDSVESALNAENGGALRVELCANLLEGGTTPTAGVLKVMKSAISLPVFVMIRPRGGDFCYTPTELQVMKEDIMCLKQAGADGFVFGVLNRDGDVDESGCAELQNLCLPLPTTFHRAIDMSRNIYDSLDMVMRLGFSRVLTSGGHKTALLGIDTIRDMIVKANNQVIVMPGGGLTTENIGEILKLTGAKEFHGTARHVVDSVSIFRKTDVPMGAVPDAEYSRKVTSLELVANFVKIANSLRKERALDKAVHGDMFF